MIAYIGKMWFILLLVAQFATNQYLFRQVPENFIHLAANGASFVEGNFAYYINLLFREGKHLANGYHNLTHTLYVTWMCVLAAAYYVARGEMTLLEARDLILAALFHDWGHSGTKDWKDKRGDVKEVMRAANGFRKFAHEKDLERAKPILCIIWATCFPYLHIKNISLSQQLIREIDMSQALQQTWLQIILFGLGFEWGKNPYQMLAGQAPFLRSLKFETKFGKMMFERLVARKLEDIRLLEQMITPQAA